MKKIIFLAVSLLFACVAANAQDIILKTDNSIITALVQEINENEIIYKDFSNPKGPIFKVSIKNVQKIKFSNGSEQVFNTAPQTLESTPAPQQSYAPAPQQNYAPAKAAVPATGSANNYGTNYPAYSRYDLYNKSDEQLQYILREDAYRTFRSARGQVIAGGVIWGTGLGFAAPGLISLIAGAAVGSDGATIAGGVFFSLGNLLLAAGIPFYCVGNARLKWVYSDYEKNGGRAMSLSFGETRNGYGLKLSF